MRRAALPAELFLLSLAVILLEVSYTRVFSFKLVYYFTYLIIGIALLGLCAAGVLVLLVISPPGTVLLAGVVLALAGVFAAESRELRLAFVPLALVLAAGAAFPDRLPDPVPDRAKNMSPQQTRGANVLFSRWSP